MPIPFLSSESPNLAIVDWCLMALKEVSIGEYVIEIMMDHFFRFRCLSFALVDSTIDIRTTYTGLETETRAFIFLVL